MAIFFDSPQWIPVYQAITLTIMMSQCYTAYQIYLYTDVIGADKAHSYEILLVTGAIPTNKELHQEFNAFSMVSPRKITGEGPFLASFFPTLSLHFSSERDESALFFSANTLKGHKV